MSFIQISFIQISFMNDSQTNQKIYKDNFFLDQISGFNKQLQLI